MQHISEVKAREDFPRINGQIDWETVWNVEGKNCDEKGHIWQVYPNTHDKDLAVCYKCGLKVENTAKDIAQ